MYLHIGADYMVKHTEIVAIFNLRDINAMAVKKYLENNGSKYIIVDATCGEERSSLVLTNDKLYISTISSLTLKKRVEEGTFDISNIINE